MKDVVMGYLSKTLNQDNEQLAELLYKKSDDGNLTDDLSENALETLLRLDAERVQKLKPNTKELFDNGYKKGQSEISERWERSLREKFGIEQNDLKGDAILDAILSRQAEGGMKADKVKTHPEYLALETQLRKREEELRAEFEAEIQKREIAYSREQTWGSVSNLVRQSVRGLNPVLPNDQGKADRLLDLFVNTNFRDFEYQPDGNGGFVVMKDGQRVENQHGHVKALQDLVRETAETYFEFNAQKPAGNAGNTNTGSPVQTRFNSEDDYYKARAAAAGDPAKQKAVNDAWRAQSAATN